MVASKAEGIWFFRGRWHGPSHNEDGVIERLQQANRIDIIVRVLWLFSQIVSIGTAERFGVESAGISWDTTSAVASGPNRGANEQSDGHGTRAREEGR